MSIEFDFHDESAEGKIVIERGNHGIWITMPEISATPIAGVDLYYRSPNGVDLRDGKPVVFRFWIPGKEDPELEVEIRPSGVEIV